MTDGAVPEGWYVDPADGASERWWDGRQWTGARRPASQGAQVPAAAPTAPADPAGRPATPGAPGSATTAPRRRALTVGVLVAMVALVAVALVALLSNDNLDDTIAAGEMDSPDSMAPSMADAVVHQPVPWVAFGELPGDLRYEDLPSTYVQPTDTTFTSSDDRAHIQFDVWPLDEVLASAEVEVADFGQIVAEFDEAGSREFMAFETSQPVVLPGGLEGVQWWVQKPEEQGGDHASYLMVDLGDQVVGVRFTYREGQPGSPGSPTRAEVDSWLRTIRIDPIEVGLLFDTR